MVALVSPPSLVMHSLNKRTATGWLSRFKQRNEPEPRVWREQVQDVSCCFLQETLPRGSCSTAVWEDELAGRMAWPTGSTSTNAGHL